MSFTAYSNRLSNKFKLDAIHFIATEAFMKALPLSTEELSSVDKMKLFRYTRNILDTISNESYDAIMNSAYMRCAGNFAKETLISDLNNIACDVAYEAMKRVEKDVEKSPNINIIVDKTAFTKDEYESLAKKKERLSIDDISNIIQKKVVKVIKSEKDEYEKESEDNERLKELLAERKEEENINNNEPTESEDSVEESFMINSLPFRFRNSTKHHISLFSKLQDNCMEALTANMYENISNDSINFDVLNDITFITGLESLRSIPDVHDTVSKLNNLYEIKQRFSPSVDALGAQTMICSIIAYTALETFSTLNLFKPEIKEIQKYIDKDVNYVKTLESFLPGYINEISTEINNLSRKARTQKDNIFNLNKNREAIEDYKVILESIVSINSKFNNDSEKLLTKLDNISGYIDSVVNTAKEALTNTYVDNTYDKVNKAKDVAVFDKLHMLYNKNQNVSEIRIKYDSTDPKNITLECLRQDGQIYVADNISLAYTKENDIKDYIVEAISNSLLNDSSKNIYLKDIRGYKKIEYIN